MNKSIKDMPGEELENLHTLGLDDTFDFRCTACGKCCKHREDIILTPYDTFRLAEFFGRTPQEIIERYCEVYEGADSHFPVVHVPPVPPDNACPFLRNRKCVVHAKKPVLCRVYPLARILGEGNPKYYFNGASCKHEPRTVTVRDWIADVASGEAEHAGTLWRDVILAIYPVIQPDKLNCSPAFRQKLIGILITGLWLHYDMRRSFAEQLERNFQDMREVLQIVKEKLPDADLDARE